MCEISASKYALTSLAISANFLKFILRGYAVAPQTISFGFSFSAMSRICHNLKDEFLDLHHKKRHYSIFQRSLIYIHE